MKSKRIKIVTFFFLTLVSAHISAMHTFKNSFSSKFGWKSAAAATLAGGLTLGHYGLALYIPFSNYPHTNEADYETNEDVDPTIEQFTRAHLKKCGIVNQDSLKIKQAEDEGYSASITQHHNWIFIPRMHHNVLKAVLECKDSDPDRYTTGRVEIPYGNVSLFIPTAEYLKEAIASLQHEGTHIVNQDITRLKTAAILIPLITEVISFGLKKKFLKSNNYWIRNGIKIPSGLAKGYCNGMAFFAYSRSIEQKADDGIQDNIVLLKSAKEFWKRQIDLAAQHKSSFFDKKPFYRDFDLHPNAKIRIKKFKHRIQALKQKEDSKVFEDPLTIKEQETK